MKAPTSKLPGRPKSNPLIRREQLRLAKRAQRERERAAGTVVVPLKLSSRDADRMRAALKRPGFTRELRRLLDDELIEIAAYENLKGLCWNRRDRYLDAEEAFHLYERNWRFVDTRRMKSAERALIKRLTVRFGNVCSMFEPIRPRHRTVIRALEALDGSFLIATEAYGKVVAVDAKRAAVKMIERADWRRRCVAALSVTDTRTLLTGLSSLAASRW